MDKKLKFLRWDELTVIGTDSSFISLVLSDKKLLRAKRLRPVFDPHKT